MLRLRYILVLLGPLLAEMVYAHTGPGGVGVRDGSSALEVWLRGDDVNANGNTADNPANGSQISSWSDFSGNANNYTNTGANRPTYNSAGTFNAVNFNAAPAAAQFLSATSGGSYSDGSAYFVLNAVNAGSSNTLFDAPTQSMRVEQWNNQNVIGFTRYGVADYTTSIASPFGINTIMSFHKQGVSANMVIRSNTNSETLNIGSAAAGIPYDRIGRNANGADEASGDFYEVILYSNDLNAAQIIIIDNYLSAKYGSISIANDIYNEDNPGNGNYDFEVAGIGRVDASNQHVDAQGTGMVRVLNADNLSDDEFLLWGHDNGALTMSNTADVPVGIGARLARVWRASEVNAAGSGRNVGAFDMRWDMSGVAGVTAANIRLLIDTDNDGVFNDETPITGATDLGSNVYQFTVPGNVQGIRNNRRFTVGIIGTPLLNVSKTASVATANPGDAIDYTVVVNNTGNGDGISIVVTDDLSPFSAFRLDTFGAGVAIQCSAGCPASGLSLGTPTFSNDNGATFTYVPTSGGGGAPANHDVTVTHFRLPMTGSFNATTGSFTLQYQVQVR